MRKLGWSCQKPERRAREWDEAAIEHWRKVEWLLPYAPDLNPAKAIWNHAKYADLPNCLPADVSQLYDQVTDSLNDQPFRPALLRSFLRRAKLDVSES